MLRIAAALPPCPTDPSGAWQVHAAQAASIVASVGMALLLLWLITRTRRWPWWLALPAVWLTTILAIDVPLFSIQRWVESHSIGRVANFATGSWALTWGANVLLPAFFAVCCLIWRRYPQEVQLARSTIQLRRAWFAASVAIGVAAATSFHHHDAPRYSVYQFNSLSKIFFDWGIYWTITALVIYLLGVVLLSRASGRLRWVVLVLVLLEGFVLWHEAKFAIPGVAYHGPVDPTHWFRACVARLRAKMAG